MSMTPKKKPMKHNYTSELELKSLLIRIKNFRADIGIPKDNDKINKYIKWHTAINTKKYENPTKRNIVKNKLKLRIVELSEKTCSDQSSYERFGAIILLMIQKILTKPTFSGYTYKDDFYSDAVYKILKYLHNFNHKLISERTGVQVNAFAYISQIIHNSVLFILNTKKKELSMVKRQIQIQQLDHNFQLKNYELISESLSNPTENSNIQKSFNKTLKKEFKKLKNDIDNINSVTIVFIENEEILNINASDYDIIKELNKYDFDKISELIVDYSQMQKTVILDSIETTLKDEIVKLKDEITRVDELIIIYPIDYRISFDEYNDMKELLKGKCSIIRNKE